MPKRLEPIRTLEWVIVVSTVIQALYVYSSLYKNSIATNGATAFTQAVAGPTAVYIFMGVLLVGAACMVYGLIRNNCQWRGTGLFIQGLARFFNVLTVILFVGLFPLTWIYPATCSVFCIVLWAYHRLEVNRGA